MTSAREALQSSLLAGGTNCPTHSFDFTHDHLLPAESCRYRPVQRHCVEEGRQSATSCWFSSYWALEGLLSGRAAGYCRHMQTGPMDLDEDNLTNIEQVIDHE